MRGFLYADLKKGKHGQKGMGDRPPKRKQDQNF